MLAGIGYYISSQVPARWTLALIRTTAVLMADEVDPADVALLYHPDDPGYEAARARLLEQCHNAVRAIDAGKTRLRLIDEQAFIDVRTSDPEIGRTAISTDPELVDNTYPYAQFPVFTKGWDEPTVRTKPLASEYGYEYGAFAPIRNARGEAIGVFVIGVQASPFDHFKWRILVLIVGMMLSAIVGAAVVAWFAARWISKPVTALDDAMRRVEEDDLSARMPDTHRRDEFRRVAERFNEMVKALRERAEMKASLAVASDIQRRLLPEPPQLDGYDLDGQAEYCDDSGGDYYDFIPLDPGPADDPAAPIRSRYWAIALGDVAGHGIGPALLMAWSRAAFRVASPDHSKDLQGLFDYINQHVFRDTPASRFITMFYAVLDTHTGRLHWSSAGHEPAVLIRANGDLQQLKATAVPLGLMDNATFPPGDPVQLSRGDRLIVTSDGITQMRNAQGEFFDVDGVFGIARRLPHVSSRELCRELIRAARHHADGLPIDDDITAVALRVTGPPAG